MDYSAGMVFHALFRAHHNAAQTRLNKQGLGDVGSPRLLILLRKCDDEGHQPSQKELADLLHISPATVACSLKSLERNGYVQRKIDPADTRRNKISITQKAIETMDATNQIFQEVDNAMFYGFSQEEVEQISEYHFRMLQNLYKIGADAGPACPAPPRKDESHA